MGELNQTGKGMYPLNHASQIAKLASDIMFSIAVNDANSALVRLRALESACVDLRASILRQVKATGSAPSPAPLRS